MARRAERRAESAALYGRGAPHRVSELTEEQSTVKWKDLDGEELSSVWNNGVYTPSIPEFTGDSLLCTVLEHPIDHESATPLSYFRLFWTEEIHNLVVYETNLYGREKRNNWKDVTSEEFSKWLGILIYMGCAVFPTIADYWSTSVF